MTPREQIVVSLTLVATLLLTVFFGYVSNEPNERTAAVWMVILQIVFLVAVILTPAKESTTSHG